MKKLTWLVVAVVVLGGCSARPEPNLTPVTIKVAVQSPSARPSAEPVIVVNLGSALWCDADGNSVEEWPDGTTVTTPGGCYGTP